MYIFFIIRVIMNITKEIDNPNNLFLNQLLVSFFV